MRNRVGVILFLALVSGLMAAYLAFRFLRQPTVTNVVQASEAPAVTVMVAARDLPFGHILQQQDVRAVEWPAGSTPQGFAREASEVVGRGLISEVRMNEALLASKIANPGAGGGMPLGIPEGSRAVAVRVNEVIGVAGWVHEGHRVDVLVTLDQGAQVDQPVTRIVLQDIPVLRIGQIQDVNDQNEAVMVTVATLLVTPEEAERLTLAETKGQIRLSLRNPLDRDTVETNGVYTRELLAGRRVAPSGPVSRAAPPRPAGVSVEIISGTQKTTETTEGGGGR